MLPFRFFKLILMAMNTLAYQYLSILSKTDWKAFFRHHSMGCQQVKNGIAEIVRAFS
jgi:hypothetical protein